MSNLQSELKTFQKANSKKNESVGIIGGEQKSSSKNIPDLSDLRESFFESLTTAAIAHILVFELEGETVKFDRIARIEFQSWIRGFDTDGNLQVMNLMEANKIYAA
jgi:hypothetical protein